MKEKCIVRAISNGAYQRQKSQRSGVVKFYKHLEEPGFLVFDKTRNDI